MSKVATGPNVDHIIASSLRHNVDPAVALADAHGEGGLGSPALQGDIGYPWGKHHGTPGEATSFGPFQLHWGGAMPRSLWGNEAASEAWANSAEGIDYCVAQLAAVGATADQPYTTAIDRAVRLFERPARPAPEVHNDIDWYRSNADAYREHYGWDHGPVVKPAFDPFPGQMGPTQGNRPSIELLQRKLTEAGFYHGPIDGKWSKDVSIASQAVEQSHDVIMFIAGNSNLDDYWGHYDEGHGTYSSIFGPRKWAFLAWLHAVKAAG